MTGKSYKYTTTVLEPTVHPDQHVYSRQDPPISVQMVGAIMTQLSMKAGIKQGVRQQGMPAKLRCISCTCGRPSSR
jgi:hypothetical protein